MMLYNFENLSLKLSVLGYPKTERRVFRVIKKDFTKEEHSGNVVFKSDGIYLIENGIEYKGYMYHKHPNIARFGIPKFHVCNCETIVSQRNSGFFDNNYYWHNSNSVTLEDRETHEIKENVILELCYNCKKKIQNRTYTNTQEFFDIVKSENSDTENDEIEVDIFGYKYDWNKISTEYRISKEYTCEVCSIKVLNKMDRRYIHVHHKNGNKLDNRFQNLKCLCILCHSNEDITHEKNFDKQRLSKQVISFVMKYLSQLKEVKNPHIAKFENEYNSKKK